ncbi:hypothetical protein MFLAVUS_010050 [Mucor flavus]|uniref:Uncharacterized protein n=1 Tax=Mucor flavus TaxID=439312 RepID=A0ABP9ZBL3_9FUNG
MGTNNIEYKENITASVLELERKKPNSATPTRILIESENLVLNDRKQESKKKIKECLHPTTRRFLSAGDMLAFKKNYENIKNKKWIPKSGRAVKGIIFEKVKEFNREHPGHGFVLDTTDDMGNDVSTEEEIKEVEEKAEAEEFEEEQPKDIINCLSGLDEKKTFHDIYSAFKDVKVDRYEKPEVHWCLQSVLDFIDLFYNASTINVTTEQDLLDEVYGFIKKKAEVLVDSQHQSK